VAVPARGYGRHMALTENGPKAGWAPDACTLPAARRPERAAEFDRLFADFVVGSGRPAPTTLQLELKPQPAAASRAAELAVAESACCSFFTFTLTARAGRLMLDVTVPSAYRSVLDGLADRCPRANQPR
jgi:hypothetical protein